MPEEGGVSQQARILSVLRDRAGELVTINDLRDVLWPDPDLEPDWAFKIIHVQVHRARKAVADGERIDTIHGKGYRLERAA